MSAAECIRASNGEGVDVSSEAAADATTNDGVNEEIIETIDTEVIEKSNNCDSVQIDSTSFIEESDVGAIESKEIKSATKLRPILTNGSIPRSQALRKKSVSFDNVDESVKKFINGEPIVDKQNPFRYNNRVEKTRLRLNGHSDQIDDEYITKEDVLKESKYVKTYIKNPDKYFTYDPSIVERLKDTTEEHSTRIPTPRKPIPIPRKLSRQTKERLKELTIKYSPPKFYNTPEKSPIKHVNGGTRVDRLKYPDLADIKVKTGTDLEKSLYNPDEVAINVKKFDDRFKLVQFGSQDDLDDIAEQTDVDTCDDATDVDEGKKSFTNTVNSEEFREFLKKKGLTLMPQDQSETNGFVVACDDRMEGKKKRSMLQRLFNGGFFSSKGKTTPKDHAPKDDAMKRVVLERASFHQTPSHTTLANNEFHKVFGAREVTEDYVDMNPSTSKQQRTEMKEIHGNYIDMTPKSVIKKNIPAPQVRASVHHVDSSTGTNRVMDANIVYRNIDMGDKSKSQQTRLRAPVARNATNDISKQASEKPPVLRRTPVRQSLVQPRVKVVDETMYGNLNRSNSLPRHQTQPPQLPQRNTRLGIVESMPARRHLRLVGGYQSTPVEKMTPSAPRGPTSTSTPTESDQTQISNDLSPIVASTSVQVDTGTWLKIKELKEMTDRKLLYSTPQNNKPIERPIAENIYESTEKLRPIQYGRIAGRRLSVEPQATIEAATALTPAVLVRNSPQRNTIDTLYRNRNLKIVDGQCLDENRRVIDAQSANQIEQQTPVRRERSQSALDNPISYGTLQRTPQEGVIMRKRQPVYLSREEILNRVKEFCRKSMNNTPTREQSPEISPVSYASVDSRRSGRVAPQVPRRVESLPPESPIYAPVYRQAMPQVQRIPVVSSAENVLDTRPHYQTPPRHLIQVGNQIYAPIRRPIPPTMYGSETAPYLHLRNTFSGIPPKTPRPSSVQGNPYQRRPLDGRSTPLVLHSIVPRTVEQVVYSRPIKQQQRPVETRYHNVPYESESGSEAGEIQRILQRKVEEDWQNDKSGTSSSRAQQQEQAADDRRRGGRREDPRRHTLGGGDMMHYGPGQGPPQQRTMDLEVTYTRAYH